jgi:hypothetical protein
VRGAQPGRLGTGEGRVEQVEQRRARIDRGEHGVGRQVLAILELDTGGAAVAAGDPRDRCAGAPLATGRGEPVGERVGQTLRAADRVPLPDLVVEGLPQGEQRAAGLVGRGRGVGGEGGDGSADKVAVEPLAQQAAVGGQQQARQPQRAAVASQRGRSGQRPAREAAGVRPRPGAGVETGAEGGDHRHRVTHPLPVAPGLVDVDLGDRCDGALDVTVEADDASVAEHGHGEGVHLAVLESDVAQPQVVDDVGGVDDVVCGGVGVEPVAADELLGARTTAEPVGLFEDEDVLPRACQVAGRDETVVSASDDDHAHDGVLPGPGRTSQPEPPALLTEDGPVSTAGSHSRSKSAGAAESRKRRKRSSSCASSPSAVR